MKVCNHNGIEIAVLTRNEHCPPHVHAGHDGWDARFVFSFWHNSVKLWDVDPEHKAPSEAVLETLRQVIEQPANLRKARNLWWTVHSGSALKICLSNKYWHPVNNEEVDGKAAKKGMLQIQSAMFDPTGYVTTLKFVGGEEPLEIQL